VSLAVYIVPMALLALTRIASRAASDAGCMQLLAVVALLGSPRWTCAGLRPLLSSTFDFYHSPEPGSEIVERRAKWIKVRADAKVFAEPLGSRSSRGSRNEPERRRDVSRKLSAFVDIAFVPSGLADEPTLDVSAVTSLMNHAFVPSPLRPRASVHNLVPEHSTVSCPLPRPPNLQLDPARRKRRERKRRGSEEQGADSAPAGAETTGAPITVLASGPNATPTLLPVGCRRNPAPRTAAWHSDPATDVNEPNPDSDSISSSIPHPGRPGEVNL
jgi:hypothetical protein